VWVCAVNSLFWLWWYVVADDGGGRTDAGINIDDSK
jgi:hypothetical protein